MSGYRKNILELSNQPSEKYALDWLHKVNMYKTKIIFGGGGHGHTWINMLKGYNVKLDYVCDNNENYWGCCIDGIQCIAPSDLRNINKDMVVIIAIREYSDIQRQLLAMGILAENIMVATTDTVGFKANYMISKGEICVKALCNDICSVADICADELSVKILYQTLKKYIVNSDEKIDYTGEAYFIPEIGKREHEIFVDVGAFNGDTLESFKKVYGEVYDKYFAFELDTVNYQNLCNKVAEMPEADKEKIFLYNIGLGDRKAKIHYTSNGAATNSNIYGECEGIVDKLDDILREEKVTFIKMDIEGAETAALKGCIEHICRYKPVMAICVYHSINDLTKIPLILKEFGYKIIIRHHDEKDSSEIVCYAYGEENG